MIAETSINEIGNKVSVIVSYAKRRPINARGSQTYCFYSDMPMSDDNSMSVDQMTLDRSLTFKSS